MEVSKYIIKNCPACYLCSNKYVCDENNDKHCELVTDCLLKQIYELCKSQKSSSIFAVFLADRILKLLDVQEVE